MIPSQINIELDQHAIKKHIEKQLNDCIQAQLWFCDANKIAELCCLSVRFLEDHVFSDYRMRAIMVQKNRKRLWRSDKAFEVIEEIFNEW